jgi:ABC-type amino acid transport substrate-binding protein
VKGEIVTLNPGDTLLNGQYRILRLLGRGGFGYVYLAQEVHLSEEVAIKELIPALVGDETMLRRFLAEAKATRRLTHDRIVRTHHVFDEGGNFYIVMEYMPGGSLEERLRERGSLPAEEAVRLGAEVCEGLSYAHSRGVVHCDLKPANILFTAGGSAKVADFGIAYVSEQMLTRSWLTPAGFMAGTLPYMSPEQTDGVRDDPRIDVYALGAVLYRVLTGRSYLEFDPRETPRSQADNVQRIFSEQPLPPSAYGSGIPAWLDPIVLKALAKRPDDRFGSAGEMRAALLHQGLPPAQARAAVAAAQVETRVVSPQPRPAPPSTHRPARRRMPAWFWVVLGLAAALLLAVVAGSAILFSGVLGGQTPTAGLAAVSPTTEVAAQLPTRAPQAPTRTPEPPPPEPGGPGPIFAFATNPEHPPFEFRDQEGRIAGFDLELLGAIAEAGEFRFELVEVPFDDLFPGLAEGRFDAAISGLTITPERDQMADFSTPYFDAGLRIVVREADRDRIRGAADLEGLRVSVLRGSFADAWVSEHARAEVLRFDEPMPVFEVVQVGEADAAVSDLPTAVAMLRENPDLHLVLVDRPVQEELYGIAVNKERRMLLEAVNRGLAIVQENGTYEQIYDQWFGPRP